MYIPEKFDLWFKKNKLSRAEYTFLHRKYPDVMRMWREAVGGKRKLINKDLDQSIAAIKSEALRASVKKMLGRDQKKKALPFAA